MNVRKRSLLTAALLALIAAALTLWTSAGAAHPTARTAPAIGKDAGTLTYAEYTDVSDWDPSIAFSTESIFLPNVYEPLVWYRAGDLKPGLAESWKTSEDGLTWTFQIRKGVKFHDGSKLNAAAVKSSIERTKTMGKGAAYVWDSVAKIETAGPYTVRFRLKYPAPIDLISSGQYGAWIFSPKAAAKGTAWFGEGRDAGTGPYRVASWEKGQQIVLQRFPGYWRGWNNPHYGKVVIRVVTEPSTRVQMIKSGEAQFAAVIPAESIPSLRKDKGIQVLSYPGWRNRMWLLNTKKGATADVRVRRALSYAFDADTVAKEIYEGAATPSRGPIPATMWGASTASPYKFDLGKAKQLLGQAGYGPSNRLKLTGRFIAGVEGMQNEMLLFQKNLGGMGVDLELDPGPWPTIWDKAKVLDTAPNIQSMTWWPTYPTPNDWLIGLFKTEAQPVFNLSHYSNPAFDSLLDRGVKLEGPDRPAAIKAYRDAQKILLDDAAAIFAVDFLTSVVKRKNVVGYYNNPAYETVFFYGLRPAA